jgi:phospholipid/cholesterol/gamma-HCH transport system permease protein
MFHSVLAPVLRAMDEAGGITLLLARVVRGLTSFDPRELARQLVRMGTRSVPIVVATAFFTGGIMVVQSAVFVKRYGATALVGWGTGYATLRELGPLLIALMFSGRVGANNTAELGTMAVTEQLDGLRCLALDPVRSLVVPRVLAMIVALFVLTLVGDVVAMLGATVFAQLLLDVSPSSFYYSFAENLSLGDLAHGLIKSTVFGLSIALTSCHFGMTAQGGAVGVGRAVNAAVVSAALSIVILDFVFTFLLG